MWIKVLLSPTGHQKRQGGRERVWKKRYINRGESIMIFEIVRGIEMDVPIPTNYCGIRRREKGREVFFREGVFWGNIDINKMNRGMFV